MENFLLNLSKMYHTIESKVRSRFICINKNRKTHQKLEIEIETDHLIACTLCLLCLYVCVGSVVCEQSCVVFHLLPVFSTQKMTSSKWMDVHRTFAKAIKFSI